MVWLIALKGAPGTGKSTLGAALSRRLGWSLVDKDDAKDILDGRAKAAGALASEIMLRVAHRQLGLGLSVVCDSPLPAETYGNARRVAAETGARRAVVECRCCDEAVWRRRVEARQGAGLPAHRTVTWDGGQAFHRRHAGADGRVVDPHLIVDTATDDPALVERVVDRLGTLGAVAEAKQQREKDGRTG